MNKRRSTYDEGTRAIRDMELIMYDDYLVVWRGTQKKESGQPAAATAQVVIIIE